MTNSQLWSLLYFHLALIGSGYTRYSRFDIAISFSNLTSKFSISVFNLSVANYCIGGLLDVEDGVFGQRRVFEGDLLRLNWHPKQAKNKSDGVNCFHAGVPLFHHSQWIAVIIEDRNAEQACSPFALVNYTVFATDAAAILFLHNFQSPFNLAAKEDDNFRSKALSLRHRLGQLLRRGANSPVFISLPIDMFTDLPNQLAAASESPLIAVTGAIEFFVESPPDRHSGAVASSSPSAPTDLSSSLLLLLIVFVLFLLLAILFVPARLGICFWQRLCFASVAYSAKTKRSRKLTAATKKALKQLPVKHLNQVDPLLSEGFDQCAICIELFKPNDLIRSLPCRHMYHRACIDPWLLKHRSCPLCKQNILISCGMSVAEEDMDSCSATTSELNSAFSFSSASNSRRPSSVFSSASRSMEALFCFSLGNSFGHRRRRTDRRQRHLSSSFEETEPSLGRRVLGSASENSSSSISATGAGPNPSEVVGRTLFATAPGAALSPPLAEKVDDEETRRQSNLLCCCIPVEKRGDGGGGSGGGGGGGGQNIGATPFLFPATPHQSAMVFYQLPQAMAFSPMSVVSKASLPSYEQVAGAVAPSTLLTLAAPHQVPHQPIVNWNQRVVVGSGEALPYPPPDFHRHPTGQPQQLRSGAKTDVVYAVLSASGARMCVDGTTPAPHLHCDASSKTPMFVKTNAPRSSDAFGGYRQGFYSSPPPMDDSRPPPPAYPLATASVEAKLDSSLRVRSLDAMHPLLRAARFIASGLSRSRLFPPTPLKSEFSKRYYDHVKGHHHHHSSHHHHHHNHGVSLNSAKFCSYFPVRPLDKQHRRKTRHHRRHRPYDVDHGSAGGVGSGHELGYASLGKTLILGPDGAIIQQGFESNSLSESSCEENQRRLAECLFEDVEASGHQHIRVRSVRVTVEPQVVQCHIEPGSSGSEKGNPGPGEFDEKPPLASRRRRRRRRPNSLPNTPLISSDDTACSMKPRPSASAPSVFVSPCSTPSSSPLSP